MSGDAPQAPTSGPRAQGELIVIGRLGAPHGVAGEMRFFAETDFPERLRRGRRVALCPAAGEPVWTRLRAVRPLRGGVFLVEVEGVDGPQAARPFTGGTVAVAASELPPLPEGRFYHHQLVGLAVLRPGGAPLGRLARVLVTGANDVFVVTLPAGGEVLVPAIRDAVEAIDVAGGVVRLRDLPGLLDGA